MFLIIIWIVFRILKLTRLNYINNLDFLFIKKTDLSRGLA